MSAHSSRHGTTCSISSRNVSRRVFFVYRSKPFIVARLLCCLFVDLIWRNLLYIPVERETLFRLSLANNKSTADAVMDVKEQPKPNTDINKVATSMTVTLPNGDLIWSRTKTGEGFIHSGAGEAVEKILHDLSKDACPRSHYRRHMG